MGRLRLLGLNTEEMEEVYAHHHPDFLGDAADGIGRAGRR